MYNECFQAILGKEQIPKTLVVLKKGGKFRVGRELV